MHLFCINLFLVFIACESEAGIIETHENATVREPDPNCPMVGIDCVFNDIERAANVG